MNRKEIEEEILSNSPEEQKEYLLKFLNICKTSNEWMAFTVCHWKRTGKMSYESERIWTLKENMLNLLKK